MKLPTNPYKTREKYPIVIGQCTGRDQITTLAFLRDTHQQPHLVEEDVAVWVERRSLSERGRLPDGAQAGEQVLLQLPPGHQGSKDLLHPRVIRVAPFPTVLPHEALTLLCESGRRVRRWTGIDRSSAMNARRGNPPCSLCYCMYEKASGKSMYLLFVWMLLLGLRYCTLTFSLPRLVCAVYFL